MIKDPNQLLVTLQQMERLMHALDDLKENVLPTNPVLFAAMAEAPMDQLASLRHEISGYVHELKPTA